MHFRCHLYFGFSSRGDRWLMRNPARSLRPTRVLQLRSGFLTPLDRHGIHAGEDWETRLGTLIRDADTVVFVLTNNSVQSPICAWEVEEARRLGKRILPVLPGALANAKAPAGLASLNYIFFYDEPKKPGSGFGAGLLELVEGLKTDLAWLREHTRLLQRAIEWYAGARPSTSSLAADLATTSRSSGLLEDIEAIWVKAAPVSHVGAFIILLPDFFWLVCARPTAV